MRFKAEYPSLLIMEPNIYQTPTSDVIDDSKPPTYPRSGAGKRFLNYFIDTLVFYALALAVGVIYGLALGFSQTEPSYLEDDSHEWVFTIVVYGMYLLYPCLMEAFFGRTVGKFCTRTKVVNLHDGKPSFGQIVGRTLCRLIPFDAFSFLGSNASGWHDSIPKTKVVDTSKPPVMEVRTSRDALDPAKGAPMQKTPSL